MKETAEQKKNIRDVDDILGIFMKIFCPLTVFSE